MLCPIAPVLVLGAIVGGSHTLVVLDRRGRHVTWLVLAALAGGWAAYALMLREPRARIALECLTVLALAAGTWRATWLARRGVRSSAFTRLGPWPRRIAAFLLSPGVLATHVWLAAMLTMEWRDKAHFAGWEYAVVAAALALAAAEYAWSTLRTRRSRSAFAALASFADRARGPACPLGFGGDAAPGSPAPTREARP